MRRKGSVVRSRTFTVICLAVFVLIVFLPPIIHGYVYPSSGDDTAIHLQQFDKISRGELPHFIYLGQAIVGYPLVYLSKWIDISIDTLFLWFNFLVLVGAGLTLYFVLSRLVNRQAGLVSILLVLFCSSGVLALFYSGTIFNIINVLIILPFALYFITKSILYRGVYNIAWAVVLCGLFLTFHPTGLLLPGIQVVMASEGSNTLTFPSFSEFVSNFITFIPLGLLIFAEIIILLKKITLSRETKLFVIALLVYSLLLIITAFSGLSPDPIRQAIDLATILSIISACLVGVIITKYGGILFKTVIILILILGSLFPLVSWFSNNSAIKPVDLVAISYLNGTAKNLYSCSTQVAPWIYDRFLDITYTELGADFIIYRSEPMTARTDPNNHWYLYDKVSSLEDYEGLELLEIFSDNYATIYIFSGG